MWPAPGVDTGSINPHRGRGNKMAKNIPTVDKEWRQRVSFDFGKGGLVAPEGFKELSIGDEITVMVTGKVNSLRQDEDTSNFSLQMEKIELETGGKAGISDALKKAARGQKIKK